MEKIFKQFWPCWVTVIAVVLPWFFKSGYLFFTDFLLGPKIILNWQNNQFLLNLLFKLFSFVLPLDIVEKLFFSWVLLLVFWAGRCLIKQFLLFFSGFEKNEYLGLTFGLSLFLLFNPFIYDRIMYGQWGIVLGYGFFIGAIGYLFKSINKPQGKSLVYVWLFAGLAFLFAQHFVFLLMPFFLLFYCLYFKNEAGVKGIVKYSIFGILIFFIINLNWLIPAFFGDKGGVNPSVVQSIDQRHYEAFKTAGNTSLEVFKNVVMMSGFWGKDQFRYLDLTKVSDNWGRSFLFLLPIIIYGAYKSLREKRIRPLSVGLIIIWVVSVFLAVGVSTPITRGLTLWLFDHVPFYKGLRETQKWVAPIILVYVFYLSYGVWQLFTKKFVQEYRFVLGIFLAGVIVMQAPLLLWGLNRQVMPVKYPADWYLTNQKIVGESNCQRKVLFFPWHLYMGFKWVGGVVSNPASVFFSCPVISGSNMEWGGIYESVNQETIVIDEWVMGKSDNLLGVIKKQNIGYIILAKEVDYLKYLPRLQEKVKVGEFSVFSDTETMLVFKAQDSVWVK